MESLALTVAGIVFWLICAGVIGMALSWSNFSASGILFGALSVISGAAFFVAAPGAPIWMALWAVVTGLCAVHIGMMTFLRTRE